MRSLASRRNRYNACRKARVEPKFRTWNGKGSLIDFVLAQNLERRHLDASDKALLAVRLKPMYADEAKERQQEGRIKGGKARHSEPGSTPQKIGETSDKHEGEAAERAAKAAHSNSKYVRTVERLKEAGGTILRAGTRQRAISARLKVWC